MTEDEDFNFDLEDDFLDEDVEMPVVERKGREEFVAKNNLIPEASTKTVGASDKNTFIPEQSRRSTSPLQQEQEDDNAFDDNDSVFSQINCEKLLETSEPGTAQDSGFSQEPIPRWTSTPKDNISLSSGTTSDSGFEEHQSQRQQLTPSSMGPPLTSTVLRRPSTSSSASSLSTPPGVWFPFLSHTPPTSSTVLTTVSHATPQSPREAFFANWDKTSSSQLEERFKPLKRRFPGPAGLLPVISPSEIHLLNDAGSYLTQSIAKIISTDLYRSRAGGGGGTEQLVQNNYEKPQTRMIKDTESQDQEILKMNKAPWRELVRHLNLNPNDPQGLLKKMNINWLRKRLAKHHSITTKIPFLAMVVQVEPEILVSKRRPTDKRKNPSIKLMDCTGTIVAAMDASFVNMYGTELSPGTGIAVKNAGFLRFKRQLILTVNRKNIICVTSIKQPEESVSSEKKMKFIVTKSNMVSSPLLLSTDSENVPQITETKDGVRILRFSEFSSQKAMEEYEILDKMVLPPKNVVQEEPSSSSATTLFAPPRRPATVTGVGFPPVPLNRPQQQFIPPRNITTAPPSLPPQSSDSCSMFDDDEDEELVQALDEVDFERTTEDSNSNI